MIGIVDYGMGNLLSIYNALEAIGKSPVICRQPDDLMDMSHIILPGVGSFNDCMLSLKKKGFNEALDYLVVKDRRPILGICLGMQVMSKRGYEGGECKGLGFIDSEVVKIQNEKLKVPHIGWNSIDIVSDNLLFSGLGSKSEFYFVHSYHMKCEKDRDVSATTEYGEKITSVVQNKNVYGVQFHPEKSQDYGLKLLDNFSNI